MFKKLLRRKQNSGFTLVEVIISIGALGLICAVLLRLFVLSSDTNEAAGRAQRAELVAASVTETVTCAHTIEEGLTALGLKFEEDIKEYTFTEQGFTTVMSIDEGAKDFPGRLYKISVSVRSGEDLLANISTMKYVQRSYYD